MRLPTTNAPELLSSPFFAKRELVDISFEGVVKRDFFELRPVHVNAIQHFRLGFCRPLFSTATHGEILATGTIAYMLNFGFIALFDHLRF